MPGRRIIEGGGKYCEVGIVTYDDLKEGVALVTDFVMRQIKDDAANGFAQRVSDRKAETFVIADTTIFA